MDYHPLTGPAYYAPETGSRGLRTSWQTLADFETNKRKPYDRTLADIRRTLEEAGVEFIPENGGGAGIRFRERKG